MHPSSSQGNGSTTTSSNIGSTSSSNGSTSSSNVVEPARKKRTLNVTYGQRKKICENCETEMPVAKKKCDNCDHVVAKKSKTPVDFIPAGRTALTRERNIIKGKLLGVQQQHHYHCISLSVKMSADNGVLDDVFATPGFATEFLNSREGSLFLPTLKTRFKQSFSIVAETENLPITSSQADQDGSEDVENEDAVSDPILSNDAGGEDNTLEDSIDMDQVPLEDTYDVDVIDNHFVIKPAGGNGKEVKVAIDLPYKLADELSVGYFVGVHTDDPGTFWLFKMTSIGKKISGNWVEMERPLAYVEGKKASIVPKNIIKKDDKFIQFEMNKNLEGEFILPIIINVVLKEQLDILWKQ